MSSTGLLLLVKMVSNYIGSVHSFRTFLHHQAKELMMRKPGQQEGRRKDYSTEDLTSTPRVHSFHLSTDSFLSAVLHLDSDPRLQCEVHPPYSSLLCSKQKKLSVVVHTCNPTTVELRQEEGGKVTPILGYTG